MGKVCIQAVSSYKDCSITFLKGKSSKQTYSAILTLLCEVNTLLLDNLYLTHLSTEKQKEDENCTTKSSQSR